MQLEVLDKVLNDAFPVEDENASFMRAGLLLRWIVGWNGFMGY